MIRTKEELVDRLAQEKVWRIREISELKNIVQARSMSCTRRRVVCRSGVAILYAHWEGFVKKSGTYFLEYVASQRLTLGELKGNFVTIAMKGIIDQASIAKKYSAFEEITNYIRNNQGIRARIPYRKIVDTESNLSSTVLKEVAWCLGIDYSVFSTKEKFIDAKLVARRNYIAHGEVLEVDESDFLDLANEVVGLIEAFRGQLENATVNESYKTVAKKSATCINF